MSNFQRKYYSVRWAHAGKPSVASVSIYTNNDYNAKRSADRIGKGLNVSNVPRTIYEGGRRVE